MEKKRVEQLIQESRETGRGINLSPSDIEHGAIEPSKEEIEKKEAELASLRKEALARAKRIYHILNLTPSDIEHGAKELSDEQMKEYEEMLEALQNEFNITLKELDPSIIVEEEKTK